MGKNQRNTCISVIIPVYNSARTIGETLHMLEEQTAPREKFEVIVVDDGSSDATHSIIEEAIERNTITIRYIYQQNDGIASASNLAISLATGDILAFTDGDCLCDPDWIEVIDDQIRNKKKQLVGGYIYCHDTIIFPWKMAPVHQMGVTANMAVDRAVLPHTTHIFNADFKGMFGHDIHFVETLRERGIIQNYVPEMRVLHPANILSFKRIMIRARGRANEIELYKLHGTKVIGVFAPFFKPLIFGRISVFACSIVAIVIVLSLLGRWGGGQILTVAIALGCIAFLLYFYRFLVIYRPLVDTKISFGERWKTLGYFLFFIPLFFYHRIRGSILFNFFML